MPPPPTVALPTPADAARTLPLPVSAPATDGQAPDPVEVSIDARIDNLDDHISALAARRTNTVGGGVVALLMGGTYIGLGAYAGKNGYGSIARYFYLVGGASVVSAGVNFGLQPNPERAYDRLQLIRADAELAPSARLAGAEHLLSNLARRRMASRYIQGALDLGLVVGSMPVLFGDGGFDPSDGFDWIVATSAGIGAVQALTTMFRRSEEERRWRMYRNFAERHGGDGVFVSSSLRPRLRMAGFGGGPAPGGGAISATFIF